MGGPYCKELQTLYTSRVSPARLFKVAETTVPVSDTLVVLKGTQKCASPCRAFSQTASTVNQTEVVRISRAALDTNPTGAHDALHIVVVDIMKFITWLKLDRTYGGRCRSWGTTSIRR